MPRTDETVHQKTGHGIKSVVAVGAAALLFFRPGGRDGGTAGSALPRNPDVSELLRAGSISTNQIHFSKHQELGLRALYVWNLSAAVVQERELGGATTHTLLLLENQVQCLYQEIKAAMVKVEWNLRPVLEETAGACERFIESDLIAKGVTDLNSVQIVSVQARAGGLLAVLGVKNE